MPEPGLSEITNMAVDPERGTGTPAVIYDNREVGRLLNENAQFKAKNDWAKYNLFLGNLKDAYKDLNEIAKQPVMQEDMPVLRKEMGEILSEIGKDPRGYFSGGPKFNEIQSKISGLQSKATESKGNSLFNEAHRMAILRNPAWESPSNKSKIDNFGKQPLGSRQLYQFDMPGLLDMDALADGINKAVRKESDINGVTPDNQFILSGKEVSYDPERFKALAAQAYEHPDSRNVPLRKTWEERFNMLPQYEKDRILEQYPGSKDPIKDFFIDQMAERIGQGSRNEERKPNPNYLEKEKLNVDKFKAQSGRIAANASALRAQKYAQLMSKKIAEMDENEKKVKNFWGSIVGKVEQKQLRKEDGGGMIIGDYIFEGNLPPGYKNIGGLDKEGKPIPLIPKQTPKGVKYFDTKYYDINGSEIDLLGQFNEYKKNGGKGSYNDLRNKLLKDGNINMELVGQNGIGNFETAFQTARAISNKGTTKGEEPIFSEETTQE